MRKDEVIKILHKKKIMMINDGNTETGELVEQEAKYG